MLVNFGHNFVMHADSKLLYLRSLWLRHTAQLEVYAVSHCVVFYGDFTLRFSLCQLVVLGMI